MTLRIGMVSRYYCLIAVEFTVYGIYISAVQIGLAAATILQDAVFYFESFAASVKSRGVTPTRIEEISFKSVASLLPWEIDGLLLWQSQSVCSRTSPDVRR